jgi:RHH-type rel operon transcriptional repressor/antitoxin RelB
MISLLSLIPGIISAILDESLIAGKAAMAESPMLGARCPVEWQQQIQAIATASGRKEAEVIREALGQYLGKTDPGSIKGAIANLEDRVADLERKLAGLGRRVG